MSSRVRPSHSSRFRRHPLSLAVAALFSAAPGGAVLAQQAPTSDIVLDNVTVTATRRNSGVQDTPLNITAVTGAEIQRQGLTDMSDLVQLVPGIYFEDTGGRDGNPIIARGLNVDQLGPSGNDNGGSVATYIGDIPLYLDFKLFDINRVEVLLGPQGTLYGAGSLGGAIRYIPNRPNTSKAELEVRQDTYGINYSSGVGSKTVAVGNLPLSENAALRASLGYIHTPGYSDANYLVREPGVSDPEPDFTDPLAVASNLQRKKDSDSENTLSGNLSALYRLSEQLDANLSYFYQDQSVGNRSINQSQSFGTGRYENGFRFLEPNDRRNQLLSLEVNWDLDFAKLTSATGFSRYTELGHRDQTDLLLSFEYGYEDFPAFAAFTTETGKEKRLNQELRLVSAGDGPFSWIVGGFFNQADSTFTSSEFTPGIPEFFEVDRPDNLEYFQLTEQMFTEVAGFGELGYQITPPWQVTVGARVFKFKNTADSGFALPLIDGSAPDEVAVTLQSNAASDDDAIFKFNTSYQFNKDLMGYLTVSEGYRPGGVNSVPPCLEPLPDGQNVCALPNEVLIKPDKVLNHEIGFKTSWLKNRLFVNGAVYYIDWKDVQVAGTTVNGNIPILVNAAKARSEGVELQVVGLLSRNWRINANYAYVNAELTEDAPGIVRGDDAFSGDRLPGSPKHQGSLLIAYNHALFGAWSGSANYGVRAVSNRYSKVGLRNFGEALPGYVVHRASLSATNRQFTARLYAENLFNRYVETSVRNDTSYIRAIEGDGDADNGDGFKLRSYYKNVLEPLRVGLSFSYDFKL
ncbi:MAG: TonB-dependent receptor [Stagnimonas sp.]|nr:TonB-dependent receptor [Stagnimonas sp.]